MQDKDQKLIWENYNKSIPVSKPKFTSKEIDKLMGMDKKTPKPTSIKVNKEEEEQPNGYSDQGYDDSQQNDNKQSILGLLSEIEKLMPQVDVNWQVSNGNQTGVTPETANFPRTWAGLKDFLNNIWESEEAAEQFGLQGATWENKPSKYSPSSSLYTFFNDSHKAPGRSKHLTQSFIQRMMDTEAGIEDRLAKHDGPLKVTPELQDMFKSQTDVRLFIEPKSEGIQARNTAVSREINRWKHD